MDGSGHLKPPVTHHPFLPLSRPYVGHWPFSAHALSCRRVGAFFAAALVATRCAACCIVCRLLCCPLCYRLCFLLRCLLRYPPAPAPLSLQDGNFGRVHRCGPRCLCLCLCRRSFRFHRRCRCSFRRHCPLRFPFGTFVLSFRPLATTAATAALLAIASDPVVALSPGAAFAFFLCSFFGPLVQAMRH
jgi:hypothetical protein